jgi:hypothetical protein
MPRKRTISPGFFTHPELYEAEMIEGLPLRLAFAGLWCVADRRGRFHWKPRQLKLDILPFDDLDFGAVLLGLKNHGFIRFYVVDGKPYGDIPTFADHQHPHPKEADSTIPAYNDEAHALADACVMHDSSMSHVPPYQPVGCSSLRMFKPSDIQRSRSQIEQPSESRATVRGESKKQPEKAADHEFELIIHRMRTTNDLARLADDESLAQRIANGPSP